MANEWDSPVESFYTHTVQTSSRCIQRLVIPQKNLFGINYA